MISVYADELVTADGEFRPSAEVPDIPSFSQLHQQIFGKLGSGVLWEALKTINLTHAMQRIAKVAPNTPPEAIASLRHGFSQMIKDQEFIQEFKKVTRSDPAFEVGGEADKLIKKLIQAPPEVKIQFENTLRASDFEGRRISPISWQALARSPTRKPR